MSSGLLRIALACTAECWMSPYTLEIERSSQRNMRAFKRIGSGTISSVKNPHGKLSDRLGGLKS